jgi:hypothetical protein
MPFVGKYVRVIGIAFERGTLAIVITEITENEESSCNATGRLIRSGTIQKILRVRNTRRVQRGSYARAHEGVAGRRLVSNPDFRDTEAASRTSRRPSGGITLRVNRRGATYSAQEISDHGHRT